MLVERAFAAYSKRSPNRTMAHPLQLVHGVSVQARGKWAVAIDRRLLHKRSDGQVQPGQMVIAAVGLVRRALPPMCTLYECFSCLSRLFQSISGAHPQLTRCTCGSGSG